MPECIWFILPPINGENERTHFSSRFKLFFTALPCRASGKNCRRRQKLPGLPHKTSEFQLGHAIEMKPLLIGLFCLFVPVIATAMDNASPRDILETVEAFVRNETRDLPGRVVIKPGRPDSRQALQPCQHLEAFLPSGGRIWGRFSVGVRCHDGATWTFYIPVEIEVIAPVAHASQPVSMGKLLNTYDIVMREVDLARMPEGVLNNPEQAVGQITTTSLASGQPIRRHHLRAPHVITRGQKVQLIAAGRGFTVSTEGNALTAAAAGEIVQVRSHTGRIISGIARPNGVVEVSQ